MNNFTLVSHLRVVSDLGKLGERRGLLADTGDGDACEGSQAGTSKGSGLDFVGISQFWVPREIRIGFNRDRQTFRTSLSFPVSWFFDRHGLTRAVSCRNTSDASRATPLPRGRKSLY